LLGNDVGPRVQRGAGYDVLEINVIHLRQTAT
jgi:hypothetical protein